MSDREQLRALYREALGAVHAGAAVRRSLERDDPGPGPFHVLAAGKAASAMASAARDVLGPRCEGGEVVTKDERLVPLRGFELRTAGHPLPDERSVVAARAALERARRAREGETVLVLLSGGASSLWSAPAAKLELEDKRLTTRLLLRSGADIRELNTVRKQLSAIKGGALAAVARPARVLTLAVSDVAGDDPQWIGSAPSVPNTSCCADAWAVLESRGILAAVPPRVRAHLEAGRDAEPRSPPAADAGEYRLVATLGQALDALVRAGRESGLSVRALGRVLDGEARDVARQLAGIVRSARSEGVELLVAGGEPTVHVSGDGRGGRAQELALALALALKDVSGWVALVAGTDGSDGPTPAAGGLVDAGTLARAERAGLDARAALARNDSYRLLEGTGDLLVTGPTETNVADLALIRLAATPPGGIG